MIWAALLFSLQAYNPEEFKEALLKQTNSIDSSSYLLIHSNAMSAYDGVWTIAKAWKSVESSVDCENSTDLAVTKILEQSLDETYVSNCQFYYTSLFSNCM